ncbi:glutamate-5-semialdehyde dehydrogenase [Desulfovibrio inopinatus]|uniref:glutamate-5-semialdehyde dehydrogenase n=1 Tax=Desulfovibrio inopinatus TaxID=102109 RepID=UPI00040202B6|nr:glutamate-5-semialdehyde dehydrogenase [Desulfovibrio inopinatus]
MDIETQMLDLAKRAKRAGAVLAGAGGQQKAKAISDLAVLLEKNKKAIFEANAKDLDAAAQNGLDAPKMDRLRIDQKVLDSMIMACGEVAAISDPVGEMESMWQRPNGLMVGRMRIPLGVIAMIYESRPNVTVDSAILCLLAGNAVILRGGKEAIHSNSCLADILSTALEQNGLPRDAVQLVKTTDRAAVTALLKLDDYIDVIIPRGGEGLIRAVVEQARMPVLKHYKGVCHIYVDAECNLDEVVEVVHNAKVQRPGVCNALECLLVHKDAAQTVLPEIGSRLGKDGVSFRACAASLPLLGDTAQAATDADYGYEFHDLILAVKVVDDMDAARAHIAEYGSNHTDVILTTNYERAMEFIRLVDTSMAGVNCSTRFNDGGQLGLGAEIGISTSKLHSYGVMGVKELTSAKFVVFGKGQIRS